MTRWLVAALVLAGCPGPEVDTGDRVIPAGPTLEHTPTEATVRDGDELPVEVVATDPDDVQSVTVYFRAWGDPVWEPLDLVEGEADTWAGTIPAASVHPPAVEYYFKGVERTDLELVSYLPSGAQGDPFTVEVGEVGQPVPFFEDFEGLEGAGQVYDLGWLEYSRSFEGYAWTVREDRAWSGTLAAGHRRGVEGLDELHDWLVSPPLDLSTLPDLQVSWHEWGDYADSANHALWISLGSPDPEEGDYELVAELDPPSEDEWDRAAAVDLTRWAGAELAYLAWVYRGQFADAWYLDDVSVRALGPDLELVDTAWTEVEPGGTTTVTLTLSNRMDVAATGVEIDIEVDEALATVVSLPEAFEVGGLDQVDQSVQLQVDVSHPDNAYLPVEITAAAGPETWTWDRVLVVGEVSSGHVSLTLTDDGSDGGLVELSVGAGDPDDPLVSLPFAADYLEDGDWDWTVDLTDLYAWLPPAPGELRWWLRVSSTLPGELTRFAVDFDGDTAESDDLGAFLADEPTLFYLPRPPSPVLTAASSDPTQVAPGDLVTWTVTVANAGADTVGLTTVQLTSDDDGVTVVDGGPFTLATDGWLEGESVEVVVTFQVAEDKVDSRPAELVLEVIDEAEAFEVEGEVEVPWPVLAMTALRIDDWSDGDNDGLLDPDETANLEVELTNAGDLDTFGAVYCTLEITGGTASATLTEASEAYGLLSAGETKDEDDFELTVTSGSDGDDIDLALECTDSTQTYALTTEVVLGERPWIALSAVDDDDDDAVDAYEFDIVNGRYRSDGTTLEVELTSSTEYDPTTLFLEFWGLSTGASYTYYQVVFQSGTGKLRGYELGVFTTLSTPTITEVDDTTVLLAMDIPSMGLSLDRLSMGFASGFCGGDDYYCDHFPDDWGNPYQSGMVTSRFVDMSW